MFKYTSFPAIFGAGNVENYCHKLPNKKPCLIMIIKRMKKKQIINIKIIIIITSLLSFVKYNTIKIIFMLFCIIFYKKAYFFCHIFLCFTNMFLIKRFPLCRLKLKYEKKNSNKEVPFFCLFNF